MVSDVCRGPIAEAAVRVSERLAPWRSGVLAVLTYHRVDHPSARPDLLPGLVSATPDAFATQVDALVRWYTPVSMAEVIDALADPRRLPPRAVHITFDDAYADFATHAWPVLRAARVPVTLFVPTAYPDQDGPGFWWDRLWYAVSTTTLSTIRGGPGGSLRLDDHARRASSMRGLQTWLKSRPHEEAMAEVDRLVGELVGSAGRATAGAATAGAATADAAAAPVLGWAALRSLAAEGVTLAAHTRHHPLLDRVPLATAIAEIEGGREDLEREVGPTLPVLAYPSGAHGGDAVEAARRAGMLLAVTTERGGNDLRRMDPLRIRRINVGRRARPPLVRAQVLWASIVDSRRR